MPAVDVAIIGGGIAGAATAAFVAEGGLRVRLYERTAIAAGASGRNSGIVQHPFDPVLAGLYRGSLAEYRRLADAAAEDAEAAEGGRAAFALAEEPAGLLYVGRDLPLAARIAADWAAAWPSARPEVLEGAALTRLEPALAPDLVACRLAIGFPVAPAAATEAFAAVARRRGVEIVIGGEARPALAGIRVVGVERDGRVEPAGAVVVAAGPWTPRLVDPSGAWRPIMPVWGVVAGIALDGAPTHGLEAAEIDIEPGEGGPAPRSAGDVRDEQVDFSLVPAAASSALGSTFLPDEPDPDAWLPALRRVGSRYVPGVADAPLLGLRRCARPVSRDGRPLLGRVPWIEDLWVIAGHGPWGISTGPGSARLLADAIAGAAPDVLVPDIAPRRFGSPGAPPGQRHEFGSSR